MVHFDSSQKIQQIRLYWDQGSLLKLVDVIGSRGKNWPIRDGKDQAKLIVTSAAGTNQSAGTETSTTQSTRDSNEAPITTKPRSQSKNVTRDPHASLSLFTPHEEDEEKESKPSAVVKPYATASSKPPARDYHDLFVGNDSDASPQSKPRATSPKKENGGVRAPKAQSAKPPPRDYHDLFVGGDEDAPAASTKGGASSPQKENMTPRYVAPKGGAGKNYQPSRLFDTDDAQSDSPIKSPDTKYIKPDPTKYNHFDFGEGDDKVKPMPARPKSKHQNNWDFEDFMTPEKVRTKIRGQDVRHFGWEEDEPIMDSPAKHPAVAQARPDSVSNFEFQDDGTPVGDRRPAGHPRGAGNIRAGAGMYANNVFDENDQPASPTKNARPLSTVTNLKDRRKDFDPHWDMTDESPSSGAPNNENRAPPATEARKKLVSQMGAQWEATDSSPGGPASKTTTNNNSNSNNEDEDRINPISGNKENLHNGGSNKQVGIKSSGDGMGGKKGAGRSWGFGDESDEDGVGGKNGGKFQASKIQQKPKDSGFWDF